MREISHYQIRGVPGHVQRLEFSNRLVDYWSPPRPTHLLISHDGQNVFDPRTATRRRTWRMAQNAIKVFEDFGFAPPAIIGVFHSSTKSNPMGRVKDLTPQGAFQSGVKPMIQSDLELADLNGDDYQSQIAEEIVPQILKKLGENIGFRNTAMIGSSMGGLATLNALGLRKEFFATALAFSPHWVIGGNALVDHLITNLPKPGKHKIWMSRGDRKLDATYKKDQDYADLKMRELGWRGDYLSKLYRNHGHNEKAWAKQVDDAFRFWLSN